MSHETELVLTAFVLTAAAARKLGCTPDGVRYLERTGRLPAVRVDGMRLYRVEDVERLARERIEKSVVAPSPEAA